MLKTNIKLKSIAGYGVNGNIPLCDKALTLFLYTKLNLAGLLNFR